MPILESDRTLLRDLARRVADIAALPEQQQLRDLWRRHNRLEPVRPLVLCFPEGAWAELLPDSACTITDPRLRGWERGLKARLYAWQYLRDDQVVEPCFDIGYSSTSTGWGLAPDRLNPDSLPRGAAAWKPVLTDPSDLRKLHFPEVTIDHQKTAEQANLAREVFGDILEVRVRGHFWWSLGMVGTLALMRGMDQLMVDMVDRPGWVHEAMGFLRDGTLHLMDSLEKQGVLSPNNGANYVGSGGVGITDELKPGVSGPVRLSDLWGFAEAQEVVGVSPAMHEEFILRHQIPVLDRFGLNYYGCCEPLHQHLDRLKRIPRLRRISLSPWADLKVSTEKLRDRYVYCWKPNPTELAMPSFSPERVRAILRQGLETTRGCPVEVIMKDTHTVNGQPERLHSWVKIARELVGKE